MSPDPLTKLSVSSPRAIALVLAGGDGERLQAFTERHLGAPRPKQYCAFVGTRSMLDHTLDRAAEVCVPGAAITVVAASHREILASRAARPSDGRFVLQPANRGTAAGILFGLSYVMHESPDATVAIFPSDHFIFPEWRFLTAVRVAARAADVWTDRLVLLGAPAHDLELDYGWITPGPTLGAVTGRPIRTVETFTEKPDPDKARAIRQGGGLWNTFIMVARAKALWAAAQATVDDLVPYFEWLKAAIGTADERKVLDDIYGTMPTHNFSRDVLQARPEQTAVLALHDVIWSDWGRPERILETLSAIGKEPSFARRDPVGRRPHQGIRQRIPRRQKPPGRGETHGSITGNLVPIKRLELSQEALAEPVGDGHPSPAPDCLTSRPEVADEPARRPNR